MKFSMNNNRGFSLVELMIVVGIIGILATMALPKMNTFRAKSKQAEAKSNLGQLYTLQVTYYSNNSAYGTLAQVGFVTPAGARYAYTVPANTATTFTGQAAAGVNILCNGAAADTWTVNEANTYSNTVPFGQCN